MVSLWRQSNDSLAEWSKVLASGASPQGRGFEPHSCHFQLHLRSSPDQEPPYRTLDPRCFAVGILAQGPVRGSSRAGRRPAQAWSGGLPIDVFSLHSRTQDTLAEWSEALASGASPQGRGLEPHSCHSSDEISRCCQCISLNYAEFL